MRCDAVHDYRDQAAEACFQHAWNTRSGDISLLLHDMTTLYFEVEKEDTHAGPYRDSGGWGTRKNDVSVPKSWRLSQNRWLQ